jgi:hypothetical protein
LTILFHNVGEDGAGFFLEGENSFHIAILRDLGRGEDPK